jgi:hypothetical protein
LTQNKAQASLRKDSVRFGGGIRVLKRFSQVGFRGKIPAATESENERRCGEPDRPDWKFGMLAYLAGAIEYAPDYGKGWRREITPFLRSLGHEVYDPAEDERKSLSREEQENLRAWKHTNLDRFQSTVRKIIYFDLDIVSQADYLVCYFDENGLKSGGTSGELTFAFSKGIPVYMVTSLPLEEISGWILGCCARVFGNFAELKFFLSSGNSGAESAKSDGSTNTR